MLLKFFTYQKALTFYKNSQKLRIKNRVIRDQFERASLSIVLNLSEGSGKKTKKDKEIGENPILMENVMKNVPSSPVGFQKI